MRRDSPDPSGSVLSHFEGGFPIVFEGVDTRFWRQKRRKTKGE